MQTICSPAYAEEGCRVHVYANNMPVTYVSMRRLRDIDLHGSALTVPLLNTIYLVRVQNCLSSGVNHSYHMRGFLEEVTISLGARTWHPNWITYYRVTLDGFLSLPSLWFSSVKWGKGKSHSEVLSTHTAKRSHQLWTTPSGSGLLVSFYWSLILITHHSQELRQHRDLLLHLYSTSPPPH